MRDLIGGHSSPERANAHLSRGALIRSAARRTHAARDCWMQPREERDKSTETFACKPGRPKSTPGSRSIVSKSRGNQWGPRRHEMKHLGKLGLTTTLFLIGTSL